MTAILTMNVSRLYGKSMAFSLKEWFERDAMEEGDEFISLGQTGVFRRWQLTYGIREDMLTQKQYSWLLMHIHSLISAHFEVDHIGFTGLVHGNFTMTMKK